MQFTWAVIPALFIYAILIAIGAGMFYDIATFFDTKSFLGRFASILTGAFAGALGAFCILGWLWSFTAAHDSTRSYDEYSVIMGVRAFGLESGKPYPLQIGERIPGTVGTGYFHGGVFSHGGSLQMQPGSALSVGFSNATDSYILELPTNNMTFQQNTSGEYSVTLYIKKGSASQRPVGTTSVHTAVSDCRTVYKNFARGPACKVTVTSTFELSDAARRSGLGALVHGSNVEGAAIKLSPALYKDILGKP